MDHPPKSVWDVGCWVFELEGDSAWGLLEQMICPQHGQSLAQSLGCNLDKVNLNLMGEESTGPRKFSAKERQVPCAQK